MAPTQIGSLLKDVFARALRAGAALALLVPTGLARPQADGAVTHLRLEGPIDEGTLAFLERGVRAAQEHGGRLVLELDTPGGPVEIMWTLSKRIDAALQSGVRVVAWVNDSALSAGALVALSCEDVYMRHRATIGSAQPIMAVPGMGAAPIPEPLEEKVQSVLRARFRAVASWRGRPEALAEAMVDPEVEVRKVYEDGVVRLITGTEWDDAAERADPPELIETICRRGELLNLTGPEAVALGLADGLAESLEEVVAKSGAADARVTTIEPARSDRLLGALNAYGLLILGAGLFFAYIELKAPGFGLPGILAIVCFGVFFAGRYLVGLADVPHLVLAFLGIAALVVELFVLPGTIWIGLLGGAALLAALVLSLAGPGAGFGDPYERELLLAAAARLVVTALVALVGAWALARQLPRVPVLRRYVLAAGRGAAPAAALPRAESSAFPGAGGVAASPLRPVGKVVLDARPGEELEARCLGPALERGTRVRVVEVSGGRLVVEPEDAGDAA